MKDQDIVVTALKEAGSIIGGYLEPGHSRDPVATMNRLIEVLDHQKLAEAIERIDREVVK